VVGLEEPDLAKNVIEFEAVGQAAEPLTQDSDLAVHTGE
jgi:hypothetical protein